MTNIKLKIPKLLDSIEGLNDMWDAFYSFINSADEVDIVEMDIEGVPCLDSMCLNLFVCVYKMTRKHGGTLRVTGVCDRCHKMLEISNITNLEGFEVILKRG